MEQNETEAEIEKAKDVLTCLNSAIAMFESMQLNTLDRHEMSARLRRIRVDMFALYTRLLPVQFRPQVVERPERPLPARVPSPITLPRPIKLPLPKVKVIKKVR